MKTRFLLFLAFLGQTFPIEAAIRFQEIDHFQEGSLRLGDSAYPGSQVRSQCKDLIRQLSDLNPIAGALSDECKFKQYRNPGYSDKIFYSWPDVRRYESMKELMNQTKSLGFRYCPEGIYSTVCTGDDLAGKCVISGHGEGGHHPSFPAGFVPRSLTVCSNFASCLSKVRCNDLVSPSCTDVRPPSWIVPCWDDLATASKEELQASFEVILRYVVAQAPHYSASYETQLQSVGRIWQNLRNLIVQRQKDKAVEDAKKNIEGRIAAIAGTINEQELKKSQLLAYSDAIQSVKDRFEIYRTQLSAIRAEIDKIHTRSQSIAARTIDASQVDESTIQDIIVAIIEERQRLLTESEDLKGAILSQRASISQAIDTGFGLHRNLQELERRASELGLSQSFLNQNGTLERNHRHLDGLRGKLSKIAASYTEKVSSLREQLSRLQDEIIGDFGERYSQDLLKDHLHLANSMKFLRSIEEWHQKYKSENDLTPFFMGMPLLGVHFERTKAMLADPRLCKRPETYMESGCKRYHRIIETLSSYMKETFPTHLRTYLIVLKFSSNDEQIKSEVGQLIGSFDDQNLRELVIRYDDLLGRAMRGSRQ